MMGILLASALAGALVVNLPLGGKLQLVRQCEPAAFEFYDLPRDGRFWCWLALDAERLVWRRGQVLELEAAGRVHRARTLRVAWMHNPQTGFELGRGAVDLPRLELWCKVNERTRALGIVVFAAFDSTVALDRVTAIRVGTDTREALR